MQTYAGPALAAHVIDPAIEMFNKIAGDQMQIELFYADQLVPTGELFRAMQRGTIDAVQSDDDSMASPTEVTVFGGYFPFASRYSLDVPVLFNQYGLNEIWDAEYAERWASSTSRPAPGTRAISPPRTRSGRSKTSRASASSPSPPRAAFLAQFGVVPVTLPWEDIEVAVQTGELDGIAWSGITEDYTVGWADVTNYFLTNNISGAWAGSFFANMDRWNELPEDMQTLFRVCCDQSHYYRQWWYWGGEASLRVNGDKMQLTSIPDVPNGRRSRRPRSSSGTRSPRSPRPRPRSSRSSASTTPTWPRPAGPTATVKRKGRGGLRPAPWGLEKVTVGVYVDCTYLKGTRRK